MASHRNLVALAWIVLLLAWGVTASAQGTTTGGIAGTLTDSSGGVLPGVTVTLSGPNLQGVRTVTSDAQGFYRFRNVPPGTEYRVTARLSGFRDAVREGTQVFLGQEGTINLTLFPAGVVEEVSVVAPVPLVAVTQTTTGVNITAQQFASLPSARSFQQLTTIAPSASPRARRSGRHLPPRTTTSSTASR
jgi:hypothetical protein